MRTNASDAQGYNGFTLVELLVVTVVMGMIFILIAQLFHSATAVTTLGEKRVDTDAQARAVLDRVGTDLVSMIRRRDVDYLLKTSAMSEPGNDRLAFYSQVPGYFTASTKTEQSPISVVAYRINQQEVRLERMAKGLLWNGAANAQNNMVHLPLSIATTWPVSANQEASSDYELLAPGVFRFEYGYLLKGRRLANGQLLPEVLSDTPWDTRSGVEHTTVMAFQDVAAIVLYIALLDTKSRVLIRDSELATLSANLTDLAAGEAPGDLESRWNAAITGSNLSPSLKSSIHIYSRHFLLEH